MAISKTSFHARSISLPSASHPQDASIEDHLRRLRASEASNSSSSSICQNLFNVKDLLEEMNNMVHLPHNQKTLSNTKVEEVLEGSLILLDASSSAQDAVSQMKESILDLQSSLRRGNTEGGIHAYLTSRKKISKIVSKCLAELKKANQTHSMENDETAMKLLKEVEAISLATLKSVLSFVMGKKAMFQTRGWSMVTKLFKSKHMSCESVNATEVEEIDRIMYSFAEKQVNAETKALLGKAEMLEAVLLELADGLEAISRCLVKTRVSFLNVLTH